MQVTNLAKDLHLEAGWGGLVLPDGRFIKVITSRSSYEIRKKELRITSTLGEGFKGHLTDSTGTYYPRIVVQFSTPILNVPLDDCICELIAGEKYHRFDIPRDQDGEGNIVPVQVGAVYTIKCDGRARKYDNGLIPCLCIKIYPPGVEGMESALLDGDPTNWGVAVPVQPEPPALNEGNPSITQQTNPSALEVGRQLQQINLGGGPSTAPATGQLPVVSMLDTGSRALIARSLDSTDLGFNENIKIIFETASKTGNLNLGTVKKILDYFHGLQGVQWPTQPDSTPPQVGKMYIFNRASCLNSVFMHDGHPWDESRKPSYARESTVGDGIKLQVYYTYLAQPLLFTRGCYWFTDFSKRHIVLVHYFIRKDRTPERAPKGPVLHMHGAGDVVRRLASPSPSDNETRSVGSDYNPDEASLDEEDDEEDNALGEEDDEDEASDEEDDDEDEALLEYDDDTSEEEDDEGDDDDDEDIGLVVPGRISPSRPDSTPVPVPQPEPPSPTASEIQHAADLVGIRGHVSDTTVVEGHQPEEETVDPEPSTTQQLAVKIEDVDPEHSDQMRDIGLMLPRVEPRGADTSRGGAQPSQQDAGASASPQGPRQGPGMPAAAATGAALNSQRAVGNKSAQEFKSAFDEMLRSYTERGDQVAELERQLKAAQDQIGEMNARAKEAREAAEARNLRLQQSILAQQAEIANAAAAAAQSETVRELNNVREQLRQREAELAAEREEKIKRTLEHQRTQEELRQSKESNKKLKKKFQKLVALAQDESSQDTASGNPNKGESRGSSEVDS